MPERQLLIKTRRGQLRCRSRGNSARAAWRLAVAIVLAGLIEPGGSVGLGAASRVEVGVNDFTGKPIFMPVGMAHPVTVDYRGRDANQKPAADAVAVARAFLGGLALEAVSGGGSDFADAVARALLVAADAGARSDDLRHYAEPLYQAILKNCALGWKRRGGDLWFWNMGPVETLYWASYMTPEEKARIRNAIYSALPSDSGGNNNGRWGWIMDWPVALAFEDPDLMRGVIKAWKHWLGFNLYPSGVPQDWESYDYCAGGKSAAFQILAKYLEGLAPDAFRVPAYPVADSTVRFGFEDDRNPRKLSGVIWKDMQLFDERWTNHLAPDGIQLGINDTGPALMYGGIRTNAQIVTVKSLNLNSSAILRGGPAGDADLWGDKASATNPGMIGQTFWAYLHADPSDAIHNHYDINQLLLWWNGKHLAGDTGCDCNYDCFVYNRKNGLYGMYTYSHNTVIVDQKSQYISHGTVLDFVNTPGFRVATTDGGYAYDGVFHQRTIAMLPEYLVDLNLLPARDPANTNSHTFDYMMLGAGEFESLDKFRDFDPDKLTGDAHFKAEEEYLKWPNLLHIYPYITWGRARAPTNDWDVTWGEDGRNMRMIVTGLPGEARKAALGRAQLAHRGVMGNYKRLMNGVPKVLERREGSSASFLVLFEPHTGQSAIKSWRRVDERACEVELTNGLSDLILLRRKKLGHAWIRYAGSPAAGQRLHNLAVAAAASLKLGDLTVFEADRPVAALRVDYAPAGQALSFYAQVDAPTTLKLAIPQAPASVDFPGNGPIPSYAAGRLIVNLPAGVSRARLTFSGDAAVMVKPGGIAAAPLAQQLGLAEVKEATEDWRLNTSRLVGEFPYRRPRVYGDGAYDGMKGVAPWPVAISDDGQFAVAGSHEGYLEAFSGSNKLWRTYIKGNCLLDYNYASPNKLVVGRGHLGYPLAMTGDGRYVLAGTDAGMLYCLGRDGKTIWEHKTEGRVQSVSVSGDGRRIAFSADTQVGLLDGGGAALFKTNASAGVTDVLLSRDGKRLYYTPSDGTLLCLDESGRSVWRYQPQTADAGGAGMYRMGKMFTDIASDAEGKTLVGAHSDYGIYCFDARDGRLCWRWEAESALFNIAISDDGKHLVCSTDGELFYLESDGTLLWKFVDAFNGYGGTRISRDGKYVAVANPTGEWFLLSRDKTIVNRTPLRTPEPNSLAMTPDARRAIVGGIGYDVLMFDNNVGNPDPAGKP